MCCASAWSEVSGSSYRTIVCPSSGFTRRSAPMTLSNRRTPAPREPSGAYPRCWSIKPMPSNSGLDPTSTNLKLSGIAFGKMRRSFSFKQDSASSMRKDRWICSRALCCSSEKAGPKPSLTRSLSASFIFPKLISCATSVLSGRLRIFSGVLNGASVFE